MGQMLTVEDFRARARKRLPRMVFDYVDGAAGSERGLTRNGRAFAELEFVPSRLVDVSSCDQSAAPFGGARWSSPFAVAPMGLNGVVCPDGDLHLARAAHAAGIPFCLSTASTSTMEDVAAASSGELWFQLYVVQRNLADQLVARAAKVGITTLVLTVDVPVNGERIRDRRNGFGVPFKYSPSIVAQVLARPTWTARQLIHGLPQLVHFASADASNADAQAALMSRQMDASFDWGALDHLRQVWKGRLLVKGVLSPRDAARCEQAGVDGIIVSNHGARQLEDAISPIDALPAIRAATHIPLLLDSGVRSGSDVVKALALGASGVLLGRPLLYGLAADGERGVTRVLTLLRGQVENIQALLGCPRIEDIGSHVIAVNG